MRAHSRTPIGRKRRIRRLLTAATLVVATVTVPVVIAPSTATAVTPAPPGSATSLNDGFQRSPAAFLQALLCPVGRVVQYATSTIPGVNVLTNDLANILCALKVLGYVYKTTYIPPTGPPIVRYYRALVGVPAALDVDGNGVADFSAIVAPTLTIPGLQLTIDRGDLPTGAKVSIEAFFLDPTSGTTYVGLGEDGTTAGTPHGYSALVGAYLSSGSSVDVQVSLKTNTPPATLNTVADVLFGSNPDVPNSFIHGALGFAPVPTNFTTRLRIGPSSQEVTITSTVATKLTGHVNVVKPNDEKDVDVTVDKFSTSTDVFHQTLSNGHENTTYTAHNVVTHINGTYHDLDTTGGGAVVKVAAAIDITSLPSKLILDQFGGKTSLTLVSGVIGAVEARFSTHQDLPASPSGTAPYIAFHRYNSSQLTAGIRLANIAGASFDSSGPYVGDITFSPAPGYIQITAQDDVTGVKATGHFSNLPAHITVTVDTDNGVVTYNGHGTGIHEINIDATKPTPFFARATRLALTIDEVPALVTVDFKQNNGTVSFLPSAPIGSVSLLASDGSDAPTGVTGDYASYDDTPALWRAFAQISSIGALSFTPSPLSGTIKSGSPQLMTVVGHVQNGSSTIDVTGSIDKIPSWIDFSKVDNIDGSSTIDYNSHGQVVDTITLDAKGLPLPFGADSAHVEIDHLPSHMTGVIPAAGGDAIFDPHGDHIGRVLVQVFPHNLTPIHSIAGHQTADADLVDGLFTVDIQKIGYTRIHTGTDNIYAHWDISSAPLDVEFDAPDNQTFFKATISNPEPATIQQIAGDGIKIDYKADNSTAGQPGSNFTGDWSIDSIHVETNVTGGYMELTLQHIAPQVIICFDGNSVLCEPGWVDTQSDHHVSTDTSDASNIPPAFGFQLLPETLSGDPYPVTMQLDGSVCLDDPTQGCDNANDKNNRIDISNFQFSTVEAGFGNRDASCPHSYDWKCGNIFAYFNTGGVPLTGLVQYYRSGDDFDDPILTYSADSTNNIVATDYYNHLYYNVVEAELDSHPSGDFHCNGSPHLTLDLGDVDLGLGTVDFAFDLLSGILVNLC